MGSSKFLSRQPSFGALAGVPDPPIAGSADRGNALSYCEWEPIAALRLRVNEHLLVAKAIAAGIGGR